MSHSREASKLHTPVGRVRWEKKSRLSVLHIHYSFELLFPATGNSDWKSSATVPNRFSVTPQSRSPVFSPAPSLQTLWLNVQTYLNTQKLGSFCGLLCFPTTRYLYLNSDLNLWTVCSWFIAFINHAPPSSASCMEKMFNLYLQLLVWFLKIRELIKAYN